jgi:SAM-dependent methyltransferase
VRPQSTASDSFRQRLTAYMAMPGAESRVALWDIDENGDHPVDQYELGMHAWAAGRIFALKPDHVWDVGSDTLFLGIISQYCPVTALDIRRWDSHVSGLEVRAGTILDLPYESGSLPCVVSLSVAEHVGLSRYDSNLDPLGSVKACAELVRVLAPGGHLLLAVPIGREPGVVFCAHRLFSRQQVLDMLPGTYVASEVALYPEPGGFERVTTLGDFAYCMGCFHMVKEG